jgi:hypothetical protein
MLVREIPVSARNPYAPGSEEHSVFETVVVRDVEAFVAGDWERVAGDFIDHGFFGLDARGTSDPSGWRLTYPTLAAYRERWLTQSAAFRARRHRVDPTEAMFSLLTVPMLKLDLDSGLLLKRFDGTIEVDAAEPVSLSRESLFVLRRVDGIFRVAGFVGYLPVSTPA